MAIRSLFKAWLILAKNNFQAQLISNSNALFFIIGKTLNFLFTLVLVFAIFRSTTLVNGYSLNQAVIFVMVFNITESLAGFFFRAIYMFRPVLVKGDFDLDLVKPLPSFFRPLLSAPDFLDLPPIILQTVIFGYFISQMHSLITPLQWLTFILLIICALILTFSLYLIIASFSILTTEIDNLMSIIRSVSRAGVVPTDIYSGFFRFLITFIIPITAIVTIPSKALLGLLDFNTFVSVVAGTACFFFVSLYFWHSSLRFYTSASS